MLVEETQNEPRMPPSIDEINLRESNRYIVKRKFKSYQQIGVIYSAPKGKEFITCNDTDMETYFGVSNAGKLRIKDFGTTIYFH